jgi:hypothetical protein
MRVQKLKFAIFPTLFPVDHDSWLSDCRLMYLHSTYDISTCDATDDIAFFTLNHLFTFVCAHSTNQHTVNKILVIPRWKIRIVPIDVNN